AVVNALLENEADFNAIDKNGCTPLHYAARHGHTAVVNALLENEADFNAIDNSGCTPLYYAAKAWHEEKVVNALLKNGANVNAPNKHGSTPLRIAVDLETKKLLIKYIAKLKISNPDIVNDEGFKKNKEIIEDNAELNECYEKCKTELQKLKLENVKLYEFSQETKIDNLVNLWCKHKSIQEQEELKTKYPHYADIFIDKINGVKKHIFIKNNEPIVNYLFDGKNEELQSMLYDKLVKFVQKKKSELQSKISQMFKNHCVPEVEVNYDVSKLAPQILYQMSLITLMKQVEKEEREKYSKNEKNEKNRILYLFIHCIFFSSNICSMCYYYRA
ncbi:ankyrin repeat domain-containing protein, partial [Wolbachia endosymbiont of Pentidionis agamae]|uniref:ankyrin repeat domain-containing protein n=1 Tax=Wolbachia endosymbiont of Pentidionis agamae TaxID=3110435 RepID=UPI002FCF42C7